MKIQLHRRAVFAKGLSGLLALAVPSLAWADLVNTALVGYVDNMGATRTGTSNTVTVLVQSLTPPPPPPPQPPGGSPLPNPDLTGLPSYAPVNGTITATYPPGYSNIGFNWTITAKNGPSNNPNPYASQSFGMISKASSANFQTASNVAGLASYGLTPGVYTVTVQAFDSYGNKSSVTSQDITLVQADFSNLRVFPNPWRSDKHTGKDITFAGLPLGSTVKIFTVSGHFVATVPLNSDPTMATWKLTNDSGDRVASGIYLYLISVGDQKARGQVVVIK